ncbi:hypothetical protein [Micromonospora coxensis]|uniref:DUF3558 domain-containing protein n=1 Tax=Micromonospora coxensis TaxID=356852 RepID=A0A1C5IKS2_9ACTN|nr:hypothetical protein [Micromonospora coxensis]SCG58895.1 Protein of unknown function [Micromonospora coxensis]
MTDGEVRRRARWWRACAAAAVVISGAAACGSAPADQPAPGAGGPSGSTGAATVEARQVDACALLSTDEVTQVIGATGDRAPRAGDSGDGGSSCVWENPDTYHSITIDIGRPGTAVGGTLPAESAYGQTEPGPDGIRFASGNIAEFAVRDRACEIQVVTKVTDDTDQSTAIRLIGLVRDRA